MQKVQIVQEILRRWDPFGVEPGSIAPADEYDSHAPHVVTLVKARCTLADLAAHLDSIGCAASGDGLDSERNSLFAAEIIVALGRPIIRSS